MIEFKMIQIENSGNDITFSNNKRINQNVDG